ncbi:MAG: DUF5615 family PIN-like protein [Deltaproteobacteria bacterium]|jgi:predicted nuclease of predicted toxin-antitoxin system
MKYYLDEDISPRVAEILRGYQVDVMSTYEAIMSGSTDRQQLEYAASKGMAMVTRNRNDFVRLTVQFFNEQRPHCGVLIVPYSIPGDRFRLMAQGLKRYASKHSSGREPYTIDFLER